MKKRIHFSYEPCEQIKQGSTTLRSDGSFLYAPSYPVSSFSIYPYHWSFEITTTLVSEGKYALAYCMGNYALPNYETAEIAIPKSSPGIVYADLDFPHADGVYYSDYEEFSKKMYFDPRNRILAVGDLSRTGKCMEFIRGQYVMLDDRNRLAAVYVQIR